MTALLIILFTLIAYTYVGYPFIMWLLSRSVRHPVTPTIEAVQPSISVILVVHNEEESIARRLGELSAHIVRANLHGEILLVSDGSTDRTAEVALATGAPNVRVVQLPRIGKAAALTRGVALARNEIVIFADVRQTWTPNAIQHLLQNFTDPAVGAVDGEVLVHRSDGVLAGVGLYWRFEMWLRRLESKVHSTVGASGPISAVRRKLFRSIPEGTILDDVYWPLSVTMLGYRVVHDESANAFDRWPQTARGEFRRKVRTQSGIYQLCARLPSALLPWRNPICFQFVSHKLLRLVVPWALLAILLITAVTPEPGFRLLFRLQIALYVIALAAPWMRPGLVRSFASAAASFVLLNAAAWTAFWVCLLGLAERSWVKVEFAAPSHELHEPSQI